MRIAVALSIVVHLALLGVARPIAARLAAASEPAATDTAPDIWAGTSVEVSTAVDGALDNGGGSAAPAPAPSPAADEPVDPEPPASPTPTMPPPAATPPPAPAPPATSASATPSAAPSARPASTGRRPVAAPSAAPEPTPARPRKPRLSRPRTKGSFGASGKGPAGAGAESGGSFGADGQAAVRDLGRAFTRAIPAACSADPIWGQIEIGEVGTMRVELHVNGDGRLTSAAPIGDTPPKALANLLRRTLPLLQAGTFAVRAGAVTAGTETLEIKAIVIDGGGGEAAPGGHESLAFSYDGGRGKASFTHAGGRRVELTVRVLKTEVAPASSGTPSAGSATPSAAPAAPSATPTAPTGSTTSSAGPSAAPAAPTSTTTTTTTAH